MTVDISYVAQLMKLLVYVANFFGSQCVKSDARAALTAKKSESIYYPACCTRDESFHYIFMVYCFLLDYWPIFLLLCFYANIILIN